MKKSFATVAAWAVLLFATVGHCQMTAVVEPKNIVQLASSATLDVPQDWLTVTLGTTRDGADPAAIQVQLRQALEAALKEAKKFAQSGAMEVHTSQFSLQPRYGRDGKISGWQGSTVLVLEGNDFARIGATAGKLQSLTISNTSFSLSPGGRANVESQVQARAIDRFKAKASEIAASFGFKSYSLREVSVSLLGGGQEMHPRAMLAYSRGMSADAPIPVEAGSTTVVVQVSGSVQLN